MKQAEDMIMKGGYIIPVFQQCNSDLIKSSVKGIAFHPVAVNRIYKSTTK